MQCKVNEIIITEKIKIFIIYLDGNPLNNQNIVIDSFRVSEFH